MNENLSALWFLACMRSYKIFYRGRVGVALRPMTCMFGTSAPHSYNVTTNTHLITFSAVQANVYVVPGNRT